ncbi:enoyl-CoA hydratase-related protein [Nocardioides sp. 616]|uniref:enoyl-CoA hydratase/isomerase family protein n=1 Tax=Nocardioides sp. 616 TaxID=2268090 RepID=UPI000CE32EA1|nr:enoyl-CoA hydratase-related protein [Nocardioides sp. 616]
MSSPEVDTDSITVEHHGAVTVLTLNRPDRLNALSHGLLRRFHEILDDLLYDYEHRVVVIAGAGRAFCAGMDLHAVAAGEEWVPDVGRVQTMYGLQEAVGRLVTKLRKIPQPVISVVHGVAVGGGLSIACASDVRVGEPGARFNPAFVKLGASGGDMGSSWLLPRIIGFEKAAEVLLTGRDVGAEEALDLGLLSRLVAPGDGMEAALGLAAEMCELAPFTTRMTKSLLNLSRDGVSLEQMIEVENRTQIMMTSTDDFREATRAFSERRTPTFRDH